MLGFSLHVLQAIFVPSLSGVSLSSGGALVHICRSVVKDVCASLCWPMGFIFCEAPSSQIPCFTHWSHLGGLKHQSRLPRITAPLASQPVPRLLRPLAEAGTRLAWLVPSCQESQRTAACGPGLEKYCFILSSFLVVSGTTTFPGPCTWWCLVYLQPSVFELHLFQVHISHNYTYLWKND